LTSTHQNDKKNTKKLIWKKNIKFFFFKKKKNSFNLNSKQAVIRFKHGLNINFSALNNMRESTQATQLENKYGVIRPTQWLTLLKQKEHSLNWNKCMHEIECDLRDGFYLTLSIFLFAKDVKSPMNRNAFMGRQPMEIHYPNSYHTLILKVLIY